MNLREKHLIMKAAIDSLDINTAVGLRNRALILACTATDCTVDEFFTLTRKELMGEIPRPMRLPEYDPAIALASWSGSGSTLWPRIDRWGNMGRSIGPSGLYAICKTTHKGLMPSWLL